jgi:zinc transporter ZupT
MVLYSCISPLGILVGIMISNISAELSAIVTCIVCGSFIFISICEVLKEALKPSEITTGTLFSLFMAIGVYSLII